MAFNYFENAINSGVQPLPDEMYRDQQQQFVNLMWDNTSALITIQEQSEIGSAEYNDIEVWIDSTVGDTTTGLKDARDFNKIIFQDITHTVPRGLMYFFDNTYWIVHAYTSYNSVVQDCGIRRCNNALRMIDPKDGSIFSIPCCVDYDMSAPSLQVSRYINTPNNHAVVIVQGNSDTIRLFKTNTRFLLSGRPFKLLGYQNAVEYDLSNTTDTLLYLDLFLDEIHAGDNFELGVADNSTIVKPKEPTTEGEIVFTPYFQKIRQYESISFSVGIVGNDNEPTYSNIITNSDAVKIVKLSESNYTITGVAQSEEPVVLEVEIEINGQTTSGQVVIDAVSMMG